MMIRWLQTKRTGSKPTFLIVLLTLLFDDDDDPSSPESMHINRDGKR